jgi:hypothetical protein
MMSGDLHERLKAAVDARLEMARAVTVGHSWAAEPVVLDNPQFGHGIVARSDDGGVQHIADSFSPQEAAHIAANDPTTVIRHCERDLAVLERHRPVGYGCLTCRTGNGATRPPNERCCDEVIDMAAAYGVKP